MKKLSRLELDVVVNEVVNNIKLIEENKNKELFNKSSNKDLFLSKVKEIEELEDKLDNLKEEIRGIESKFKEDNLRVFFVSKNNRYNKKESFSVSGSNDKGSSFSLYKDIEKEIILNGLKDINIKELIDDLIKKFI